MYFLKLVIYFAVFSFCGWISETIICSYNAKKFVKRGFLTGPFIPVYGFGGLIVVVLLEPLRGNPAMLYIVGVLSVTVPEYFTGWLMETVFNLKLWDYSHHKFNIKGRVWLISSLFFGVLGLVGAYVVTPPMDDFINGMSDKAIKITSGVLIVYFLADTINSTVAVASLNAKVRAIAERWEVTAKDSLERYRLEKSERPNWFQRRLLQAYPYISSSKSSKAFNYVKDKIRKAKKEITEIKDEIVSEVLDNDDHDEIDLD